MQVPDNVVSGDVTCSDERTRLPDVPCRLVYLQSKKENTAVIFLGGDTVESDQKGLSIEPGEKLPAMLVDNLNRLYVVGVEGEIIHYLVIR